MKFTTLFLLVVVLTAPLLSSAQENGDEVFVSRWAWVHVKNLEPIKSKNNVFKYNDVCGIKEGGTVTVVGMEGDALLLKYSIDEPQAGSPCPTGVLFLTSKEEFSMMRGEFYRIRQEERAELELVKRLTTN